MTALYATEQLEGVLRVEDADGLEALLRLHDFESSAADVVAMAACDRVDPWAVVDTLAELAEERAREHDDAEEGREALVLLALLPLVRGWSGDVAPLERLLASLRGRYASDLADMAIDVLAYATRLAEKAPRSSGGRAARAIVDGLLARMLSTAGRCPADRCPRSASRAPRSRCA